MDLVTLDFETPYRSRKKGDLEKYSLRTLTYEEYLRHPLFDVMGVGIKINEGRINFYHDPQAIKQALETAFPPGNDNVMLCHNTLFDGAILSWHYSIQAGHYWDTQGMSNALWPQASASLDSLAKRIFPDTPELHKGKELADFDGKFRTDMTTADWGVYGGYCIQDVNVTFHIFKKIWAVFPESELELMSNTLRMFIEPGFVLDIKKIQEYYKQLRDNRDLIVEASGLSTTLLASNQKFADHLKRHYQIVIPLIPSPTQKNPDNMKLATSKTDLEFIKLRKEHPEINHIWDARICVKSTGEINRCKRLLIHASPQDSTVAVPLKYYGAHTGRWSGTNNVNFQNFKRGSPIRRALFAKKDNKIIVRDQSNIEGRINAWFNGQHNKCFKYRDGVDIYNEVATDIYGYPVDRKAVGKDGKVTQFVEGFTGKTAELGLGYGMAGKTFQRQCAILGDIVFDMDFARTVVSVWREKNYKIVGGWNIGDKAITHMANPKMRPWMWNCIEVLPNRLKLPNGLTLSYPKLRYFNDEDSGYSGFEYWNGHYFKNLYGGILMENIIQALSRITIGNNINDITREIKPMGAKVLSTVHDEIITMGPSQHADEIYQIMGEIMGKVPEWANDGYLFLDSEGGIADNYSK